MPVAKAIGSLLFLALLASVIYVRVAAERALWRRFRGRKPPESED